ncbi:MAG: S8 family serine peptidase [Candidatus Woesearchaeota archaeon]
MNHSNKRIRIIDLFVYMIIFFLLFTPVSLAQGDNILSEKNYGSSQVESGLFGRLVPVSNEDIFTKSEDLLLLASPDENALGLSQSVITSGSVIQITVEPGVDPINEFLRIKDSSGNNVGVLIIPGCTDSACTKKVTMNYRIPENFEGQYSVNAVVHLGTGTYSADFTVVAPAERGERNTTIPAMGIGSIAPRQMIVKFKSDVGVRTNDGILGIVNMAFGQPKVDTNRDSLDELNKIFKVKDQRKLLTNLKTRPLQVQNKYLFELETNESLDNAILSYRSDPMVEFADYNHIYYITTQPNDPGYIINQSPYPSVNINLEQAWDIETGNESVVIAVIDSGLDYDHPDISANVWNNTDEDCDEGTDLDNNGYYGDCRGYDFVYDDMYMIDDVITFYVPGEDYVWQDNDVLDFNGHGSHVAGIIAAVTNNSAGIAGTCWNCKIMPLKAFVEINDTSAGYNYVTAYSIDLEESIYYAVDNNASVISMSFGTSEYDLNMDIALQYASDNGIVLVAAAGNANVEDPFYPAALENVIAVASTDSNDQKSSFSNYGYWVDVSAPGQPIFSTVPTGDGYLAHPSGYNWLQGTSMAAPFVSGLAGLILSRNPDLNKSQVDDLIINNAQNIDSLNPGYTGQLGSGLIDANKSVYNSVEAVDIQCTDNDSDGYNVSGECGLVDCDDSNPSINPNATEACNGVDDDCDDSADEGVCPVLDPINIDVNGLNVSVNGYVSNAPDYLEWDWDDGTPLHQGWFPQTHAYNESGNYTINVLAFKNNISTNISDAVSLGSNFCGDSVCDPGENVTNCPEDCGPTVSCGDTIYEDTVLSEDLMSANQYLYCLNISDENITLDCDGHWINGTGRGGIIAQSSSNVTIRNCNLYFFDTSIQAFASSNLKVLDSVILHTGKAIWADGAQSLFVSGNFFDNYARSIGVWGYNFGISHYDAFNTTIIGNEFVYYDDAIVIENSDQINIINNSIENNSQNSIWLRTSDSNILSGNVIENNYNGLKMFGVNNSVVKENYIINNNHSGLQIDSGNFSYVIKNNTIYGTRFVNDFIEDSDYWGNHDYNDISNNYWGTLNCSEIESNIYPDNLSFQPFLNASWPDGNLMNCSVIQNCGDGICNGDENSNTCPEDCGGLIAYYPLDGNAVDFSGNGHDGIVFGVDAVEGVLNQSFYFEGIPSDNVTVPLDDQLMVEGGLTVSAWVRAEDVPSDVNYKGMVIVTTHYFTPSNQKGWSLGKNYGTVDEFEFVLFDENSTSYGVVYDQFFSEYLDKWVFLTGVFKPDEFIRLYVNGEMVLENTTDIPALISYNSSVPLTIGKRSDKAGQGMWNGSIDEVKIYARALNDSEILDEYESMQSVCGDGVCGVDENVTCPQDCGDVWCGDGICNNNETNMSCTYDCFDDDKDGINNSVDRLIGNKSDIDTNIENISILVSYSSVLNKIFDNLERIEIFENGTLMVDFMFNFSNDILDLRNISIHKQDVGSDRGSLLIDGINLTGQNRTKTAYVERISDSGSVCVKDTYMASITEISGECNGAGEILLTCNNITESNYTCSELNDTYKIEGLHYSGISEFVAPSTTTTTQSGGNGGGGNPPTTTSTQVTYPQTVQTTTTTTVPQGVTPSSTTTTTIQSVGEEIPRGEINEETKFRLSSLLIIILAIIGMIGLSVPAFRIYNKRRYGGKSDVVLNENDKTLIKFIINARKKGYKDNDLKILLIKSGWDKEMVERAFKLMKK